jgi:hypothetical protein
VPEGKDTQVRLQIAFEGGQVVAALVAAEAADGLQAALAEGSPVYELEGDDGTYVVAVAKVVYVRRTARETQIGFGAGT